MIFITAQIFGLFAILFWTIGIQYKKKEDILELQIYASLCYAIQFFLLKGYTAMIIDLVAVARLITFYYKDKKYNEIDIKWLYIFIGIVIISGIFTYDGLISLLPVIIGIFYTYSTWVKNTKYLRIFYIVCAVLWAVYNIKYFALAAVIGNILEIISGIISMIRFDRKRSKDGKNKKVEKIN